MTLKSSQRGLGVLSFMGIVNPRRHSQPLFKESEDFAATIHQQKAIPVLIIRDPESFEESERKHKMMIKNGYKPGFGKYQTYYRAG